MSEKYTERFWTSVKPRPPHAEPASPCPNCLSCGTPRGFRIGTDVMDFDCSHCGQSWQTTGKLARAHAVWLLRKINMAPNRSDV